MASFTPQVPPLPSAPPPSGLGLFPLRVLLCSRSQDRFAFRDRVWDMVMDEYLLEGLFPGNTVTKPQQTTRPHELTAAVAARGLTLRLCACGRRRRRRCVRAAPSLPAASWGAVPVWPLSVAALSVAALSGRCLAVVCALDRRCRVVRCTSRCASRRRDYPCRRDYRRDYPCTAGRRARWRSSPTDSRANGPSRHPNHARVASVHRAHM